MKTIESLKNLGKKFKHYDETERKMHALEYDTEDHEDIIIQERGTKNLTKFEKKIITRRQAIKEKDENGKIILL